MPPRSRDGSACTLVGSPSAESRGTASRRRASVRNLLNSSPSRARSTMPACSCLKSARATSAGFGPGTLGGAVSGEPSFTRGIPDGLEQRARVAVVGVREEHDDGWRARDDRLVRQEARDLAAVREDGLPAQLLDAEAAPGTFIARRRCATYASTTARSKVSGGCGGPAGFGRRPTFCRGGSTYAGIVAAGGSEGGSHAAQAEKSAETRARRGERGASSPRSLPGRCDEMAGGPTGNPWGRSLNPLRRRGSAPPLRDADAGAAPGEPRPPGQRQRRRCSGRRGPGRGRRRSSAPHAAGDVLRRLGCRSLRVAACPGTPSDGRWPAHARSAGGSDAGRLHWGDHGGERWGTWASAFAARWTRRARPGGGRLGATAVIAPGVSSAENGPSTSSSSLFEKRRCASSSV